MTIQESTQEFSRRLTGLYTAREARQITHMVFEKVTGFSRLDILTRGRAALPPGQQIELEEKLHKLLKHVPVQYVMGEAWFYKLNFQVNEQVLIPRPETEELVAWITEDLKTADILSERSPADPFTVLDIGTGSGCIAIALKKNVPRIRVIALDTSGEAIRVARENAAGHNTDITFIQADVLSPGTCSRLPAIDLVVSNPPYIPLKEKIEMQLQVAAYEPSAALFVPDDDPLLLYKAILQLAREKLKTRGRVYTEIHENFGDDVQDLFRRYGFEKVVLRKDMSGRDRMVYGAKKERE